MDYSSFSHGQIESKVWLCEVIEPYIPHRANIAILGSWYNVLGFMLLTRNPIKYNSIVGIDSNADSITIADKICDAWKYNVYTKVDNIVDDVNKHNYGAFDVIINTSVEHIKSNDWFHNIPKGKLVCIQSSDVVNDDPVWDIQNPNPTLDDLVKKYPLRNILTLEKRIQYATWGYNRFMLLGRK